MYQTKIVQLTRFHVLLCKDTDKIPFIWNEAIVYILALVAIISSVSSDAILTISGDYYYGIFVDKVKCKDRMTEDYNIGTFGIYKLFETDTTDTCNFPQQYFNASLEGYKKDYEFLTTKQLDISASRWISSDTIRFLEVIPFANQSLSVVLAFILKMSHDVQSLPNAWMWVVPLGVCFAVMIIMTSIYLSITVRIIITFCNNLKKNLIYPEDLTCGMLFCAIRPILRKHIFSYGVYLKLFFYGTLVVIILWTVAFVIMFFRFLLGVDFQLVLVKVQCSKNVPQEFFSGRSSFRSGTEDSVYLSSSSDRGEEVEIEEDDSSPANNREEDKKVQ